MNDDSPTLASQATAELPSSAFNIPADIDDIVLSVHHNGRASDDMTYLRDLVAAGMRAAAPPVDAVPGEPVDDGQLDPRTAYEAAQITARYVESFVGQDWDASTIGNPDRMNLAQALDHLENISAMLLNQSERLRAVLATENSNEDLDLERSLDECAAQAVDAVPGERAGMEPVALTGRVHELKTDPEVFQAVWDGRKTFEIRRDDREGGFRVGDALDLRETKFSGADMTIMPEGCPLVYTGRRLTKIVGHRLSGYGLADRWVCLSFASIAPAAPAEAKDAVRAEAVAWMDDEGRVFSSAQMENARNHQGGPGKIVAAKYSIPLYAAPTTLRQPEAAEGGQA